MITETAADDPSLLSNVGFIASLAVGLALTTLSMWMRGKRKGEVRPADLALILMPFVVWLLASGKISKLGFAGVEIEVRDAILNAAGAPVSKQVTTVELVVDKIDSGERGAKGGVDHLPELVQRRIEALEFQLGRRDYYVGDAIRDYLETLTPLPFFRYILILDEQGRMFGLFNKGDLHDDLEFRREDGYRWLAMVLNKGGEESGRDLAALPGFVPGDAAVTPQTNKKTALAEMERIGSSILPVVDPLTKKFVGVLERGRLTADLILDIARNLDGTQR